MNNPLNYWRGWDSFQKTVVLLLLLIWWFSTLCWVNTIK